MGGVELAITSEDYLQDDKEEVIKMHVEDLAIRYFLKHEKTPSKKLIASWTNRLKEAYELCQVKRKK
jgi:hypothetical protein